MEKSLSAKRSVAELEGAQTSIFMPSSLLFIQLATIAVITVVFPVPGGASMQQILSFNPILIAVL